MPKHVRGRATVERTANDGPRAGLACRSKVWLERDGQLALSEWRIRLLEKTAETGSLARAADAIGVPYRTAWAKLKDIESSLGVRLLVTQSGGADGGGSELTPEAVELIGRFRRVTAGLSALVAERFAAEFGDLLAPSDATGVGRALPRVDDRFESPSR